jgi:C4-type Zn-finger protein
MPRTSKSKGKKLVCPRCGSTDIEIVKTWTLYSPFPDRKGRITVTLMGVVVCKKCGYKWKTVISKIKVGGEENTSEESEEEPRRGKEIVLDLDEIDEEE